MAYANWLKLGILMINWLNGLTPEQQN